MHPNIARYPDIAAIVASEIAYGMWRRKRVYDHMDVVYGARTPDGDAGYTISFHEEREAGRVTLISLTGPELRELADKADAALKEEGE